MLSNNDQNTYVLNAAALKLDAIEQSVVATSEREETAPRFMVDLRDGQVGGVAVTPLAVPQFFLIGPMLIGAILIARLLAPILGPTAQIVTLVVAVGIATALFLRVALRWRVPKAPGGFEPGFVAVPRSEARVQIRATRSQLWALLGTKRLSSAPFEPRLYEVPFVTPARRAAVIGGWLACSALCFGVLWWCMNRAGVPTSLSLGPFSVWASMFVAALPFVWSWPTYLRVAPGRVSVLRYSFLGVGPPREDSFDLRSARVFLDGGGTTMRIEPRDGPVLRITIPNWPTPRFEVVRSVLEAMLWTGDLIELPKDALVG